MPRKELVFSVAAKKIVVHTVFGTSVSSTYTSCEMESRYATIPQEV